MNFELSEAGYKYLEKGKVEELGNHIAAELRIINERKEIASLLRTLIQRINEESRCNTLVVVEGKRDERALVSLGLSTRCFWLSKYGFANFILEAEKSKKVILLLDYDRKGRYLFAKALGILQRKGISADSYYRKEIRRITKGMIAHIEEIVSFTRV